MKFNKQKENRLISALRIVNHYHSVAKAKETFEGDGLDGFLPLANLPTAMLS